MRIIVPIKQVPSSDDVQLDPQTGTLIRQGVEAIVNPLDLYAIETALSIRDKHGGEIIVISMGPAQAAEALREAISMGADEAVLLCDSVFAGSDTYATAYVLSTAIKRLGEYDLIICGERATDGETGQVGPGIASFLNLPVITYVSKIDELIENHRKQSKHPEGIRVHRLIETGYEIIKADLPVVLTVVKEIAIPRLPTLAGKIRARNLQIPIWSASDLGIEKNQVGLTGSLTKVVKIHKPCIVRKSEKITVENELSRQEAINRLISILQDKLLL
ncbi:MAG: electron transfer flavoprotein subunit beta/FixA family protein [Planctomycetes bacterium]|nr:electron transfer flavoprotein subunit beta/FixA family protein [Planctomycetota bacterium]